MTKLSVSDSDEDSLIGHLTELRQRLINSLLTIIGLFAVQIPFMQEIYHQVAEPLIQLLPTGSSMIATKVTSPLTAPLLLIFYLAVIVATPLIVRQAWLFVAPGLYRNEKWVTVSLLSSSMVMFFLGITFCYFLVLPLLLNFFIISAPADVLIMTDIAEYIGFVFGLITVFGLIFQTPVVVMTLVLLNVVSVEKLARLRPYLVLAFFVCAMVLTPPDLLSQILVAVPMWLLYELALVMARLFLRKRD